MYRILIILLVFFLFGCDTTIDEEISPYMELKGEQEKLDIINGVYASLVAVHDENYFEVMGRSDDVRNYDDLVVESIDSLSIITSQQGEWTNNISVINTIYAELYNALINLNDFIAKVDEKGNETPLGEVYFLRAYILLKLARLFGRPPLVIDNVINYKLERPEYFTFYEQIESDLLTAIDFLPETYVKARIPGETPNRGMAEALLAEVYLNMAGFPVNDESKYALAAEYAGKVIANADTYGFGLLPDFADLWKEEFNHNKEIIFGLFFSKTGAKNSIGVQSIGDGLDNGEGYISVKSKYIPAMHFFLKYPYSYRKRITMTRGYYYIHKVGTFYEETEDVEDILTEDYTILEYVLLDPLFRPHLYMRNVAYKKWTNLEPYTFEFSPGFSSDGTKVTNAVPLYLLRYATTLLTYAEAKARAGELDQSAFEAINQVRRRANHFDLNTASDVDLPANLNPEQFIDSVVWERAWELCLEPDGRWFDIVRLQLLDQLKEVELPNDVEGIMPDGIEYYDRYFYQIPQEDRWLNPNFNK